jgi:isopropylmalate/homocitrate/citramalate synthase
MVMMNSVTWRSEQWYVSRYNGQVENPVPQDVFIIDCTLREGEQQAGVVLSRKEKIRLAHLFDEIGIPQLEVGMPAVSPEEEGTIKAIAKERLKAKLIAVCRTIKEDIDKAEGCGVWGVSCSLPIGELQIKYKLKWPEEKVIETAVQITSYARQKGFYVVLSPYDTTRTAPSFLETFLKTVVKEGWVDRVRLVDTVGGITPQGIGHLVNKMRDLTGRPIEVHCHNDFGLATANTLAALSAGAQAASTALNGMGERAGCAATEEVAMALSILYGRDMGLDLSKFYKASGFLQKYSGVKLQRHKAVVGEGAFAQEAGLVVTGWKEFPFTAEPYLPELVGQKASLLLGKKSGKDSIKVKLIESGFSASEKEVGEILREVKKRSQKTKEPIVDKEFKAIVNQFVKKEKKR